MGTEADAAEVKEQANRCFLKGEFAQAVELYNKAIELGDNSATLRGNRSAALFKSGQVSEALEDGIKAETLDPTFPKAYIRQYRAYYTLGIPARAEEALIRGIRNLPDDRSLRTTLEEFYEMDNGDQSFVPGLMPGSPAADLRKVQGEEGARMHTKEALAELPSVAHVAAFKGDLQTFKENFDAPKHAHLRSWVVRTPLTSLIVSGSQRMHYIRDHFKPLQHEEILRLVLQNGWCRVDAKDGGGYTAFYHAATRIPRLDLARILLQFGADPNMPNRFLDVPLLSALMAGNFEASKFLLEAGADPFRKDSSGTMTPERVASLLVPQILPFIHRAKRRMRGPQGGSTEATSSDCCPDDDEEENRHCMHCKSPGATNACNKCRKAYYCNKKCKKADFDRHKKVCQK
eukprot:gb/GECG01014856.1/.p1 GENE.gb/GECG01014856.1/~~gb/GECG01014856.1/.p1  ORF type:complete len:403 (+),score=52.61 gb/GECG01014856.1/:1-1209(+)